MKWIAVAEYADGTSIEKSFPFHGGSIREENQEQYDIECWLIHRHAGCTYYSVVAVDE